MSVGTSCVIACAEAFRGDGRILASAMGPIPRLGAALARATFEPGLVITDGVATIVGVDGEPQGAMPFSRVFDTLWSGRRHVMMGASQVDRFGNQNISLLGEHARPKVQLLGSRGAPGNTVHHTTSYFVPNHGPRSLVESVDFVSGVGPSRGAHEIRALVTNLGVFDFGGPDQSMRLLQVHPGVGVDDVVEATPFELAIPDEVFITREPSADEQAWLDKLDPEGVVRGSVA